MPARYLPPDGVTPGAVVLDRPAPPGGLVVALESLDLGVCTVPPSVTLDEGELGAEFPITWVGVGATQIRASYDGVDKLLDVSAAGVVEGVVPSFGGIGGELVEVEPEAAVAVPDEPTTPAAQVAQPVEPSGASAGAEAGQVPTPGVVASLRPEPTYAGD